MWVCVWGWGDCLLEGWHFWTSSWRYVITRSVVPHLYTQKQTPSSPYPRTSTSSPDPVTKKSSKSPVNYTTSSTKKSHTASQQTAAPAFSLPLLETPRPKPKKKKNTNYPPLNRTLTQLDRGASYPHRKPSPLCRYSSSPSSSYPPSSTIYLYSSEDHLQSNSSQLPASSNTSMCTYIRQN